MIKLFIIVVIVAAAFGVYYFNYGKLRSASVGDLKTVLVTIRNKIVEAQIADNLITRKQGLSSRAGLGENQGMLFVYNEPGSYSFWMKDMNFPIDIIWIDENYKIVDISKNVSPSTFPQTFQSSNPAKYIIEVNANWSDVNFIKIGDLVSF